MLAQSIKRFGEALRAFGLGFEYKELSFSKIGDTGMPREHAFLTCLALSFVCDVF